MSTREGLFAGFGATLLLVLHLDFWRPVRPVLWWWGVPEELAYRLLWMFAAGIYLAWFCRRAFREADG